MTDDTDQDASVADAPRERPWWRRPAVALGAGWLAGSIPVANVFARVLRRVDLRDVGTGTVSGTSLYRVAGFGPLAIAGVAEIAKGTVGPALAGSDPALNAAAAGLAVTGHNWSPWLGGAGGRGISPATGALLVGNAPGAAVLLAGLAGGRLLRNTALGSFLADLALVPVLLRTRGRAGAMAGAAVVAPILAKRLAGNGSPATLRTSTYVNRLLFDRDRRASQEGTR